MRGTEVARVEVAPGGSSACRQRMRVRGRAAASGIKGRSMEPEVKLTWNIYADLRTSKPGIVVAVVNSGQTPIQEIRLDLEYDPETPQEALTASGVKTRGVMSFCCREGRPEPPLLPGGTRVFLFPPEKLPLARQLIATRSPDKYRVVLTMDEKKVVAVSGSDFGNLVDQHIAE